MSCQYFRHVDLNQPGGEFSVQTPVGLSNPFHSGSTYRLPFIFLAQLALVYYPLHILLSAINTRALDVTRRLTLGFFEKKKFSTTRLTIKRDVLYYRRYITRS